jgi:ABC-2 type transport system permease protein
VAYVGSSVVRGLVVGAGVLAGDGVVCADACSWWRRCGSWCSRAGRGLLGTLGLIAGLWAEKFDQMAAFQNFIIMPMTFLSGVFYSDPFAAAVLAGRSAT